METNVARLLSSLTPDRFLSSSPFDLTRHRVGALSAGVAVRESMESRSAGSEGTNRSSPQFEVGLKLQGFVSGRKEVPHECRFFRVISIVATPPPPPPPPRQYPGHSMAGSEAVAVGAVLGFRCRPSVRGSKRFVVEDQSDDWGVMTEVVRRVEKPSTSSKSMFAECHRPIGKGIESGRFHRAVTRRRGVRQPVPSTRSVLQKNRSD